jgi:hypothetical protein
MNAVTRLSVAAAAAALAFATPASAQVNYYTQGFFTTTPAFATCNSPAPAPLPVGPLGATCTGSGFTLTYTAKDLNPGPIANGSIVSLGTFNLTGTGSVTVPDNTVNFTLYIRQTAPNMGTGSTAGFITGTVSTSGAGDLSTLIWRPTQFVNIDPVRYQLIFDNVGYAANIGLGIPINAERGINALVTVPEPGTYALMATGLAGLFVGYRRRRQS